MNTSRRKPYLEPTSVICKNVFAIFALSLIKKVQYDNILEEMLRYIFNHQSETFLKYNWNNN